MRNKFFKGIRKFFSGKKKIPNNIFESNTYAFQKVIFCIKLFYLFSIFLSASSISWLMPKLSNTTFTKPIWAIPNFVINEIDFFIPVFFILWICGSFLSALRPWVFLFRLTHAIGVFYIIALINSDGHFGHNNHAYLWISIYFLLAPNIKPTLNIKRKIKNEFITFFWGAQFIICTFYFITGIWKVSGIVECLTDANLTCEISKNILTNISAREFLSFHSFAPLRFLIFDYPIIGLISYIGTIWIHLASIHFAFRTDINDLFGVLRTIFHLGTFLLFGVNFTAMTAVIVILFIASPFSNTNYTLLEKLQRIPLLGLFFNIKKPTESHLNKVSSHFKYRLLTMYSIIAYLACRTTAWLWEKLYLKVEDNLTITPFVFEFLYNKYSIDLILYTFIFSCILINLFYKNNLANLIYALSTLLFLQITIEYNLLLNALIFLTPTFLYIYYLKKGINFNLYNYYLTTCILISLVAFFADQLSNWNILFSTLSFKILLLYLFSLTIVVWTHLKGRYDLFLSCLILQFIIHTFIWRSGAHIFILLIFYFVINYKFDNFSINSKKITATKKSI